MGPHTRPADLHRRTTSTRPRSGIAQSPSAAEALDEPDWESLTGDGLDVDGEFGPVTEKALRRFQGCADITVDGICGAQTWSHLTLWANGPDFAC
ncbi:peptidoglycan-binding domain-containing protein [Streptomyces abyssomicinicus]|uniref:peptidoglycan-binding domain-containing protein n=1 Tax=Streptomyces abyssomicinicus TaxID=574929 RepID=UPI0012501BC4